MISAECPTMIFSLTDSRNISHQHTGIWMKRRWASINRFLGQVGGGILQRDVNTAGSVRNRTRTMDLNNNIENKLQIINHGRADHPRREMPEQGGQPLRGQVRPHGYPPVPLGVLLRVRQHIVRDHRPRSGRVRGRQGLPGDRRQERPLIPGPEIVTLLSGRISPQDLHDPVRQVQAVASAPCDPSIILDYPLVSVFLEQRVSFTVNLARVINHKQVCSTD